MINMNYIPKIRVKTLEEINKNQNLLSQENEFKSRSNYLDCVELSLDSSNMLTRIHKSETIDEPTNKNTIEHHNSPFLATEIQPEESVHFTDCRNIEMTQHMLVPKEKELVFEYREEQCSESYQDHVDLDTEELNQENSLCLMEFVETVFGIGCNSDHLECICPPIRTENEDEKTPPYFNESNSTTIEFEGTEVDKEDIISDHEKISIPKKSPEKNLPDSIAQITDDVLLDSKVQNNNEPTLDKSRTVQKTFSTHCKVIEGTNFAIDAFRYGRIAGVTAYFLTHFHSDHYHGLKRKFSKPIYLSRITANVLRQIVSLDEKIINVIDINNTITVDGVKVTALDANYCPGAIMLLFELESGFRILYTGDFRASSEMEINPFLKKLKIDLLYLDTAYISRKIETQSQDKSIADAIRIIRQFQKDNISKRILFVFGHSALGNEELWLQIADAFDFKVWTDELRLKMLTAIGNDEYIQRLVPTAQQADMHLIQHSNMSYHGTNEYWKEFKDAYDMILAIKPNQFVDNKFRALYRGEVNFIEIEFSEHSNETEIRKFLAFLQPERVITIIPAGKDKKKYPEVPLSWYKQKWFSPVKKQASMFDFFKVKPNK